MSCFLVCSDRDCEQTFTATSGDCPSKYDPVREVSMQQTGITLLGTVTSVDSQVANFIVSLASLSHISFLQLYLFKININALHAEISPLSLWIKLLKKYPCCILYGFKYEEVINSCCQYSMFNQNSFLNLNWFRITWCYNADLAFSQERILISWGPPHASQSGCTAIFPSAVYRIPFSLHPC